MNLDGVDNRQKKERRGQADPYHEGTVAADTTDGSMGSSLTDQRDRAMWDPFRRYAYHGISGGYGFSLACTLAAFLVRWSLDAYLNDDFPYVTFILASIVTAVYCGIPATLIAVASGGLLANWLFVSPRYELNFAGLLDQAGIAIYLTVCFSTIGVIQTWRWAWRKTEVMTKDLHLQMISKNLTKE